MEKHFAGFTKLDNRTGRVIGTTARLEGDGFFSVEMYADNELGCWDYVFDTGVVAGDLYRTCLKPNSADGYTTEDGSILRSYWTDGHASPIPGVPLGATTWSPGSRLSTPPRSSGARPGRK